ncbi:alpha/beta hydrolase family protein [Winogradskyella aurantiaca]|uniref:alpha/beta hydrolase family protein n=1 Tax=Winogradskyella aurantiaca TaxID=2219558 RepID=UPI000E1D160A|nr:alpha/beta hydrolase [Winogradskyella aurantiaca]
MKYLSFLIIHLTLYLAYGQEQIISEELVLYNDSIQLPGTLTYSSEKNKQPLVIFIQGSGNPDRNGNQLAQGVKANYIKQLRDSLNSKQIAFYSYDKRNVTQSNIPLFVDDFNFEMLVDDALVAIDNFKNDSRFNQIVLIGHSQGSLVGMLAYNNVIDKYVSLAGIGEPVNKTIVRQISNQNEQFGLIAKSHFEELKETGTIDQVNPMLASIFAPANFSFLKSYMAFDPSIEIQRVECPILILNGDKDIQVEISDAKNIHHGNPQSQLIIIKNMNHVLKTIEKDSDNLSSYSQENFPLSSELVTTLVEFIDK